MEGSPPPQERAVGHGTRTQTRMLSSGVNPSHWYGLFPSLSLRFFFFLCGPFLKSLLNLLQYYFCFMFWFFGLAAHGILTSWLGTEPTHPALEGEALTTRPPGKSPCCPSFRRTVLAVENAQYVLWFLKESDQFSSSLLVNLSRFERWSWTNTQDCQLMWRGSLVPEHHHLQRRDTLMNSVLGSSHSSPQLVLRMFLFWL